MQKGPSVRHHALCRLREAADDPALPETAPPRPGPLPSAKPPAPVPPRTPAPAPPTTPAPTLPTPEPTAPPAGPTARGAAPQPSMLARARGALGRLPPGPSAGLVSDVVGRAKTALGQAPSAQHPLQRGGLERAGPGIRAHYQAGLDKLTGLGFDVQEQFEAPHSLRERARTLHDTHDMLSHVHEVFPALASIPQRYPTKLVLHGPRSKAGFSGQHDPFGGEVHLAGTQQGRPGQPFTAMPAFHEYAHHIDRALNGNFNTWQGAEKDPNVAGELGYITQGGYASERAGHPLGQLIKEVQAHPAHQVYLDREAARLRREEETHPNLKHLSPEQMESRVGYTIQNHHEYLKQPLETFARLMQSVLQDSYARSRGRPQRASMHWGEQFTPEELAGYRERLNDIFTQHATPEAVAARPQPPEWLQKQWETFRPAIARDLAEGRDSSLARYGPLARRRLREAQEGQVPRPRWLKKVPRHFRWWEFSRPQPDGTVVKMYALLNNEQRIVAGHPGLIGAEFPHFESEARKGGGRLKRLHIGHVPSEGLVQRHLTYAEDPPYLGKQTARQGYWRAFAEAAEGKTVPQFSGQSLLSPLEMKGPVDVGGTETEPVQPHEIRTKLQARRDLNDVRYALDTRYGPAPEQGTDNRLIDPADMARKEQAERADQQAFTASTPIRQGRLISQWSKNWVDPNAAGGRRTPPGGTPPSGTRTSGPLKNPPGDLPRASKLPEGPSNLRLPGET